MLSDGSLPSFDVGFFTNNLKFPKRREEAPGTEYVPLDIPPGSGPSTYAPPTAPTAPGGLPLDEETLQFLRIIRDTIPGILP